MLPLGIGPPLSAECPGEPPRTGETGARGGGPVGWYRAAYRRGYFGGLLWVPMNGQTVRPTTCRGPPCEEQGAASMGALAQQAAGDRPPSLGTARPPLQGRQNLSTTKTLPFGIASGDPLELPGAAL